MTTAEQRAAVEALYRSDEHDLRRRCLRACRGSVEAAEDLLHDLMAMLLEPRHYRRAMQVGLRTWIIRRIYFGAIDAERKVTSWRRRNGGRSEYLMAAPERLESSSVVSEPSPHEREADDREDCERRLIDLGSRERAILRMRFGEDRSLGEIGAALGVTESRACQLVNASMDRLGVTRRRLLRVA